MGRAVHHAFLDQAGTHRPEPVDLDVQGIGDIARPVGAEAQLGHGAQVALFARGQAVKTDAEEILVQALRHQRAVGTYS